MSDSADTFRVISHPLQIKTAVQEQSPDVDVNELIKQAAAL